MAERADEREGKKPEEGDDAEDREVAAGPTRHPHPRRPRTSPKLVSRTPTANLIVFSGTRSSGARTTSPTAMTSTTAAAAAAAAQPSRPCVAPNVTTMKTTSSPSSSTPLNATVNEYQSTGRRAGRRGRAGSRSAKASASSCNAL